MTCGNPRGPDVRVGRLTARSCQVLLEARHSLSPRWRPFVRRCSFLWTHASKRHLHCFRARRTSPVMGLPRTAPRSNGVSFLGKDRVRAATGEGAARDWPKGTVTPTHR